MLVKTLSPSMDILVSSNLSGYGGDAAAYVRLMADLQKKDTMCCMKRRVVPLRRCLQASAAPMDALDVIRRVYREHGY